MLKTVYDYVWWFNPRKKVWKRIPTRIRTYGLSYNQHNYGKAVDRVIGVHFGRSGFDVSLTGKFHWWRHEGLGTSIVSRQ